MVTRLLADMKQAGRAGADAAVHGRRGDDRGAPSVLRYVVGLLMYSWPGGHDKPAASY